MTGVVLAKIKLFVRSQSPRPSSHSGHLPVWTFAGHQGSPQLLCVAAGIGGFPAHFVGDRRQDVAQLKGGCSCLATWAVLHAGKVVEACVCGRAAWTPTELPRPPGVARGMAVVAVPRTAACIGVGRHGLLVCLCLLPSAASLQTPSEPLGHP